MTNASDIQKARDVLAKWRQGAALNTADIWVSKSAGAALVLGVALNPALLDAIDLMLRAATHPKSDPRHRYDAERIAAAILVADERMSA